MMQKILKLSPIQEGVQEKAENAKNNNRILTLSKIEIKFSKNNFLLITPMGEITLEEGDRLLIDRNLLKVGIKYSAEIDNDYSEELIEEEFEEGLSFRRIEEKNLKDHPLAFLFNNNPNEE